MKAPELPEAINPVVGEDPNLKIRQRFSRIPQLSPRIHGRRPRARKQPATHAYSNDGNDESDKHKGAYASPLPKPLFTAPPPPHAPLYRFKPGFQAVPTTLTTTTNLVPPVLLASSDGLRDTRAFPDRTSPLFNDASLADIQAAIHAAIPVHTARYKTRLNLNRESPNSHPRPTTPSSKGSSRPSPATPPPKPTPTPTNEQSEEATRPFLPRARTAPLPLPTRLALRTRSQSPARSSTRPGKKRRSAPAPAWSGSHPSGSEDGERGRSRTRPAISRPMLQHPILVAGVDVGEGRAGGSRGVVGMPSRGCKGGSRGVVGIE